MLGTDLRRTLGRRSPIGLVRYGSQQSRQTARAIDDEIQRLRRIQVRPADADGSFVEVIARVRQGQRGELNGGALAV